MYLMGPNRFSHVYADPGSESDPNLTVTVTHLGPKPSGCSVQAAQRDLEYAEAIAARFPEGSALGPERDAAEERHAVAVAVIGPLPVTLCSYAAESSAACRQGYRASSAKCLTDAVPSIISNAVSARTVSLIYTI